MKVNVFVAISLLLLLGGIIVFRTCYWTPPITSSDHELFLVERKTILQGWPYISQGEWALEDLKGAGIGGEVFLEIKVRPSPELNETKNASISLQVLEERIRSHATRPIKLELTLVQAKTHPKRTSETENPVE